MKKLLVIAALCGVLIGCGGEKPSDKVMKFIDTQDMWMLSKSKTSMCTDAGLKQINWVDKNRLPATNDYYALSDYLYGKSKYSVVSEKKNGDEDIVVVKWTYPKAINDLKSWMSSDNHPLDAESKNQLDKLKARYENGDLNDLDYQENVREWVVLNDGIDPQLSESAIKACSGS